MAGSCPRNAWSKNMENGFKGDGWVGVGMGRGRCFGCGEEGHYVGQCLKASLRKCFPAGKGHLSLQCRRGPMCFRLQRVGSHGSIMSKIKTFKQLRVTGGGGFVARRVRNYNRSLMGEHLFPAKQMHSRRKCIPI